MCGLQSDLHGLGQELQKAILNRSRSRKKWHRAEITGATFHESAVGTSDGVRVNLPHFEPAEYQTESALVGASLWRLCGKPLGVPAPQHSPQTHLFHGGCDGSKTAVYFEVSSEVALQWLWPDKPPLQSSHFGLGDGLFPKASFFDAHRGPGLAPRPQFSCHFQIARLKGKILMSSMPLDELLTSSATGH